MILDGDIAVTIPNSGRRDPLRPLASNPLRSRADVAAALETLNAPLRDCLGASGARVRIDGSGAIFDDAAAELEGFARPLWGLAAAGAGGGDGNDWGMFVRGLAAGTDPAHPDFWGAAGPVDQRMVEAAAIGFALAMVPERLWEPLEPAARSNLVAWLMQVRALPFSDNNWHGFKLMIDAGLAAIGIPIDPVQSIEAFVCLDAFALDDGWYRDGPTAQMDHYVGFAFHFYALVHLGLGRAEGAHTETIAARARTFAPRFAQWFADDGAALPIGRSLSYRFGAAAFWGALAFAGVEALPWGEIKGLYLRHLRWWARAPMTRRDGLLTLGYAYPSALIAEDYSSAMSPYWAFKAFLPLALPDSHPFWIAEETPAARAERPVALAMPGLLVRHAPGSTIALSSGQSNPRIRSGPEKYGKFAYSTRYGFNVVADPRLVERAVPDSMLQLIDHDGVARVRGEIEDAWIADDLLWSRWLPWHDVTVETWLYWEGPWHVRLHRIDSERTLDTVEGGFPLALPELQRIDAAGMIGVRNATDFSGIAALGDVPATPLARVAEPNTNTHAPRTIVPCLLRQVVPGVAIHACAVLSAPAAGWTTAWKRQPTAPDLATLCAHLARTGRRVGACFPVPTTTGDIPCTCD